ncbi:MAG: hypothetical protein SAK29_16355 [Scytonema sp. PMC 1069.18]|nr:hypothetical protein [Scytonema sp. PMC 1069.18]MEC4883397.1 hypothetical protein [Scytonema sp. PMC 1070.18]
MSQFSENLKQLVRQRAGDRCEYCLSRQEYIMGRLPKNTRDDESHVVLTRG